ncbi:MAG: hypothetical protein EOM23_03505, partial [Candidatus Moranbacteria bacterium]|nr:hypothetical protein [Candidatus Moranbacteria bacterium]
WKNALCLQFTLPGSPLIYYGEEIGLISGNDPYCRQPMPWQEIGERSEELEFFKKFTSMYKSNDAVNGGEFETLESNNKEIITFSRFTDKLDDYTAVILNNSEREQEFSLISRESRLMNHGLLKDVFSDNTIKSNNSILRGKIAPYSFGIYKPERNWGRYSPYKRLK